MTMEIKCTRLGNDQDPNKYLKTRHFSWVGILYRSYNLCYRSYKGTIQQQCTLIERFLCMMPFQAFERTFEWLRINEMCECEEALD